MRGSCGVVGAVELEGAGVGVVGAERGSMGAELRTRDERFEPGVAVVSSKEIRSEETECLVSVVEREEMPSMGSEVLEALSGSAYSKQRRMKAEMPLRYCSSDVMSSWASSITSERDEVVLRRGRSLRLKPRRERKSRPSDMRKIPSRSTLPLLSSS